MPRPAKAPTPPQPVRPSVPRARKARRTWPQRLVICTNVLLVLMASGAAGVLRYGWNTATRIQRIPLPAGVLVPEQTTPKGTQPAAPATASGAEGEQALGDLGSAAPINVLLTGSDSRGNVCVDPKSPYAGAFGADELGERSDTIMVIRIDPGRNFAAILSFPRDLWVNIAGRGKNRLNSAFQSRNPLRLIATLNKNFGLTFNHYVEVDFCAFKGLVDAVNGVRVPFATPVRDFHTGLRVDTPQCRLMQGDEALAYARSRHYQYFDGKRWREDPTSDWGRIRRQQDFIKRILQRAIDQGARDVFVAKRLIDTALQNVYVDQNLTISEALKLAQRLRNFDPSTVATYSYDAKGTVISGSAVLLPINNNHNTAVLKIFKGQALPLDYLVAGQAQGSATTTVSSGTGSTATGASPSTTSAATSSTPDSIDLITVPITPIGVVPPDDPSCR